MEQKGIQDRRPIEQESRLEVHGDVGDGLLEWRDWKYCISINSVELDVWTSIMTKETLNKIFQRPLAN